MCYIWIHLKSKLLFYRTPLEESWGRWRHSNEQLSCVPMTAQQRSKLIIYTGPEIQALCPCPAGWSGPDGALCTVCTMNTFKTMSGDASCETCPSNTDSPAGSISKDACVCLQGFGILPCAAGVMCEDTCEKCPAGKYGNSHNSEAPCCHRVNSCIDCSPGKYLTTRGSSNSSDCVSCGAGECNAGASSASMYSTSNGAANNGGDSDGAGDRMYPAIVGGAVSGLVVLLGIVFCFYRRYRKSRAETTSATAMPDLAGAELGMHSITVPATSLGVVEGNLVYVSSNAPLAKNCPACGAMHDVSSEVCQDCCKPLHHENVAGILFEQVPLSILLLFTLFSVADVFHCLL